MRTAALVTAIVAGMIPSVIAAPAESILGAILSKLGADLTSGNHYGAPLPPWKPGSKPGWYYGPNPGKQHGVPCLDDDTCKWLGQYPSAIHCPPKYPHGSPSPPHYPLPPPPSPPHNPPYHTTTKQSKPPKHTTAKPYEPPKHTTKPYEPPKPTTKPYEPPKPTTKPYEPPKPSTKPYEPPKPSTTPYEPPHTEPTYTTEPYTTQPPYETTPNPQPTYAPPPPPPSGGYHPTFYDISAAVQADDYMTFGLVESVEDCQTMCDSVEGCGFVNTYHDVHGKDGSPLLTCALFKYCHGAEDADNRGGQSQPDGSINFIANSNGWCKV